MGQGVGVPVQVVDKSPSPCPIETQLSPLALVLLGSQLCLQPMATHRKPQSRQHF